MLKKIALLLLLIAPMSVFAQVRTLQVYGHYPCDARIYKSSDRHSGIAETV